ncbi:hypothetical protein B0H14DRAFT_3595224 [Mycena olivaceomarginata]|nr:hypothetical protein B0H14DRAFT_3595224 [Mycena olivaceomarginata]
MLPAILPIQELWDHIIDQLHRSQEDLQSCSLVCRALVARAQSHAFSYIHIESRVHSNRFTRLLKTSSSPHLIPYIHHLHFKNCGGLSISPLDLIPWSNLDTLTLHRHSSSRIAFYCHVLEELQTLVALPSMRRLKFCGRSWHSMELFDIFAHCTTALDDIDFETADEHWGDLVSIDLSLFPALRCIMLGEFFATDPGIPVHPHAEILLRLPLDTHVMTICFKLSGSLWTLGSEDPAHIEVDGVHGTYTPSRPC